MNSNARYTAFTLDASPLFSADTAQRIADMVADHEQKRESGKPYGVRLPAIGYTFDSAADITFPYTVWRAGLPPVALIGTPCATFSDVCAMWGK